MTKDHIINQRMCIGCRERRIKTDFIRIVKDKRGTVIIDNSYKAFGRGAYICRSKKCVNAVLKKSALNRAFKCSISDEIYKALYKEIT